MNSKIGVINQYPNIMYDNEPDTTMVLHYITIFNNLDCHCVDNIVVDNLSNLEKDDFNQLYMLFIENVELSEYSEYYSEIILDDCMNSILEKLSEYHIVDFEYDFKLMKLFIIFYLFFHVKTQLDFHNLLILYTSIFKCLHIDYSEYLISNISKDKLEEINIEYNLPNGDLVMYGGSNIVKKITSTSTSLIISSSIVAVIFLQDWRVLSIVGSALVAINMFNYMIPMTQHELMAAVSGENIESVKLSLERGADINLQDRDGCTALLMAARINNIEMVELLLERGADINLQDKYGDTAFFEALLNKNIEMVELLLKRDADINFKNNYGVTALLVAARINKNIEMVELLLERGADVNLQVKDGGTVLRVAANQNNIEMVELLLERGATGTSVATYSKIVGPVSMYYYRIPCSDGITFKKILLFGDEHTPITEKCYYYDCIYYDQYINLIINKCQGSNKCIDLYLEKELTQVQMATDEVISYFGGSTIGDDVDTLGYMRRIFNDCSKKDYRESDTDSCLINSKQVNNLRVHNIDMRFVGSSTLLTYEIMNSLRESWKLDRVGYDSILRYLLGYDDILEEEIELVFRTADLPLSHENLAQLRWIRNKTNKEYNKYKINKCSNLRPWTLRETYYTNLIEKYESSKGTISHIHLIDFYTMLRMFMDFDMKDSKSERGPRWCRNKESQNRIIAYTGHNHTENYVEVLQKHFAEHLVFSINHNENKILEFKDADINTDGFNNFNDIIEDFCH